MLHIILIMHSMHFIVSSDNSLTKFLSSLLLIPAMNWNDEKKNINRGLFNIFQSFDGWNLRKKGRFGNIFSL